MKWIEAFLKHRTQLVVVNGFHSSTALVTSWVPQGTVLGPNLFLIFINDIVNCSTSTLRLFADDCCVYRQINSSDDHRALDQDLSNLHNWSNDWQMSFNIAKCKLLSITNKRKSSIHTYNLGSEQISTETTQKYLGMTINNKLRWGDYCNITAHKANRTLGIVRRLLKPCEQDVKKRAYEALVRPQMEYASSAWSPHTDRDINKLEQVQKNAARFVTGDYRLTTSTTALVKSVGWDPLEKRRLLFQATMLYKIRNKLVNFSIPADIGSQTRSRSQRAHGHAYRQLGINVQSYGYSFFPRVIRVWNLLLLETVVAKSLDQFQGLATTYIRGLLAPGHLRRF